MKILIMGLPGSGKTTLAEKLNNKIHSKWYNADDVRKAEEDWDFSKEGRIRQALRMKSLADDSERYGFKYVICDFVAPTEEIRKLFDPDFVIWMNTLKEGRFEDTNRVFEKPTNVDIQINSFEYNVDYIIEKIMEN